MSAFVAVYLIWGSTYLAAALAIRAIPPLLLSGGRFLLAGTILLSWSALRETPAAEPGEWRSAWRSGALLLFCGNGSVVWAQQWLPSGLAALLVASVPIWMVLIDWGSGKGPRPTPRLSLALGIGLAGVGLLVADRGGGAADPEALPAALLLLAGSGCWALGSVLARHAPRPRSMARATGRQMIAGGTLLTAGALIRGDFGVLEPSSWTLGPLLAFGYLVIFGSLVAFSAYSWLLTVAPPARVATYAYVNPAVALLLGWLFLGERIPPVALLASGVILLAVMVISGVSGPGRTPGTGAPEPATAMPERPRPAEVVASGAAHRPQ